MKKYPFQPELLDALPEELAAHYRALENFLLGEICSRLAISEQINEVSVEAIRALRSHGISLGQIERAIQRAAKISEEKLTALLDDVVQRNQQYYSEAIDFAGLTAPKHIVDVQDTWAIYKQTKQEMRNITRSMGFQVLHGGRAVMLPPAKAYQWTLDQAVLRMESGAISYNEAVKDAVAQLAGSGIKTVDYDSGHVDQIDVAARRAVMTGVGQLCDQYTTQSAEYLGSHYFEISAHRGARDQPGPHKWSSHKAWQGKVYSTEPDDIYPDIYEECGYGEVDGLMGANCRHYRNVWIEGLSSRAYTDEELESIDPPPFEFEGKTYTAYEATQKQRQLERTIRRQQRLKLGYEAAEQTEAAAAAGARLRVLRAKYREFSRAAGLPLQNERTKALYAD